MTSYYHLTDAEWDGGDLQCWNLREAFGLVNAADWKWAGAPVGADGHLVSLAATLADLDAVRYEGDIDGGSILRVDLPEWAITDDAELDWDDADEDRVCITTISEGRTAYPAALVRIPAKFVTVIA